MKKDKNIKYYGIRFNNDVPLVYKENVFHKNVEIKFIGTAYLVEYKDNLIEKTELKNFHKFKKNGKYRIEFANNKDELFIINLTIKKINFIFLFLTLILILLSICLFGDVNNDNKNYWKESIISLISLDKNNIYEFNVIFNDNSVSSHEIKLEDTIKNNKVAAKNKIYPGSSGSFTILINSGKSSVNMNYKVYFSNISEEKPQNLKFKIRGESREYNTLDELEKKLYGLIERNKYEKITIDWEWPYDNGDDETDTLDGINIKTYKFLISVYGSEVIANE